MGEVRVNVKLINPIDDELVKRGLLNPNNLRVYEASALIDTGTKRTGSCQKFWCILSSFFFTLCPLCLCGSFPLTPQN